MHTVTEASLRCQKISGRICVVNCGQVYDVTEFADRHPGGKELLETHAGEDVTKLMQSHELHKHSGAAYKMMEKYHTGTYIGPENAYSNGLANDQVNGVENGKPADGTRSRVNRSQNGYSNGHSSGMTNGVTTNGKTNGVITNGKTNGVTTNGVANGHSNPKDVDSLIDLDRPLMSQVGILGDQYMDWVHSPIDTPLTLFSNPIIEFGSKSFWWLVLMYWVPVASYTLYYAFLQFQAKPVVWNILGLANVELAASSMPVLFFLGFLLWTFDEYIVHRWLFHCKPPASWPSLIWLHFLFHGQHHKSPMDKERLVFPPVPATMMGFIIYHLYRLIAPTPVALVFFAGTIFGYLCYDLVHYYLHHGNPSLNYFKDLKTYHVKHHFKDHNKGFGISSKLWDYPFGTLIE